MCIALPEYCFHPRSMQSNVSQDVYCTPKVVRGQVSVVLHMRIRHAHMCTPCLTRACAYVSLSFVFPQWCRIERYIHACRFMFHVSYFMSVPSFLFVLFGLLFFSGFVFFSFVCCSFELLFFRVYVWFSVADVYRYSVGLELPLCFVWLHTSLGRVSSASCCQAFTVFVDEISPS